MSRKRRVYDVMVGQDEPEGAWIVSWTVEYERKGTAYHDYECKHRSFWSASSAMKFYNKIKEMM